MVLNKNNKASTAATHKTNQNYQTQHVQSLKQESLSSDFELVEKPENYAVN